MTHRFATRILTLSATSLVFLSATAFTQKRGNSDIENIGNRDINKGNRSITPTPEGEIALGRALSRELEQNLVLIHDSFVVEYINRVGQNIVRNSDAKMPFTFRVINSDDITAIGLPGGFLYVNKGLVLAADNEAELAGMMAHEVAHVAARHATERQGAALLNAVSLPIVMSGGISRMAIQQAAGIGVPMSLLTRARTQEEEADWLGLQYMYKAGYDPDAMVTFFEKLQARGRAKRSGDSHLSDTNPPTEDRIKQTQKNIATFLPTREQAMITSAEFLSVKTRLMNRN